MHIYWKFTLFLFADISGVASIVFNGDDISLRSKERRLRERNGGQVVAGSFIVQLDNNTTPRAARATAMETATRVQALKQQMVANGTINDSANVKVTVSLLFTQAIKGFVITGIPEEAVSSLLEISGMINVEPDKFFSINNLLDSDSSTLLTKRRLDLSLRQGMRSMQTKNQILPWGVSRVGGPIDREIMHNLSRNVFIIDTGIAPVSDLNINISLCVDFVGSGVWPVWSDGNGHGTHVAGIIAAIDNEINVVGVIPGASVVSVRVLDNSGSGFISRVIAGINYVASKGNTGDVANLSIGGGFSKVLNNAVQNAAAKGIKFAIAAGNNNDDANFYSPASASGENIYTVSCYDSADYFCSFSNYGSVVDFSGPGKNIESLSLDEGTVIYSGTSMSAPHIAGLLLTGNVGSGGFVTGDPDGVADPIAIYSVATIKPTPAPTEALDNQLVFKLLTDSYSSIDNGWTLYRITFGTPVLVASQVIGSYGDNRQYSEKYLLDRGIYQFNFTDAYGDGLIEPSYFALTLGSVVLKSSRPFTYLDSTTFTVETLASSSSSTPSQSPTQLVTKSRAPKLVPTILNSKPVVMEPIPIVMIIKPAWPAPWPLPTKPLSTALVPKPITHNLSPIVPLPNLLPTTPVAMPTEAKPSLSSPVHKTAPLKPLPAAFVQKTATPKPFPTAPVKKPAAPKSSPMATAPKPAALKFIPTALVPKPAATKPSPIATPPKLAATKPLPIANPPKPAVTKPSPIATPPKPAATKPSPIATPPKPAVPKPSPIATALKSIPTAPLPQPAAPKLAPIALVPKPAATKPSPIVTPPKLAAAKPSPIVTPPKPAATKPSPIVTPPQPAATKPSPIVTPPKPAATKPSPIATPPKPAATKPSPIATPPQPAATKPSPIATPPKPAATKPSPIATPPKPAATKPSPIVTPPKPAAAKPSLFAIAPKPAATKPLPADTVPKEVVPIVMPSSLIAKPSASEPSPTTPVPKTTVSKPTLITLQPDAPTLEPRTMIPTAFKQIPVPLASVPSASLLTPEASVLLPLSVVPALEPLSPFSKPSTTAMVPTTLTKKSAAPTSKLSPSVPSLTVKHSKTPSGIPSNRPCTNLGKRPSYKPSQNPSKTSVIQPSMQSKLPSTNTVNRPSYEP